MASILNVMNEKLLFMLRFYEENYLSNSWICSILIQIKRNQYGLIEISIRYSHACVYFMKEISCDMHSFSSNQHHVSHIYSLLLYGYYHIFNKVPLLLWWHVVIMKLWTYCFFFFVWVISSLLCIHLSIWTSNFVKRWFAIESFIFLLKWYFKVGGIIFRFW
jgi:hypothetical protein